MTGLINVINGSNNKESLPSVINDPFSKTNIVQITIMYWGKTDTPHWFANVEFVNGLTKGEQKTPNCKTFEEVMQHIKAIEQSL